MRKVFSYIIIIVFNALILSSTDINALVLISLCIALIFLGTEYIISNSYIIAVIYFIFIVSAIFINELMLFYPIIAAGVFRSLYYCKSKLLYIPYIFSAPVVINIIGSYAPLIFFIEVFGVFLSVILIHSNIKYDELEATLIKTVDDSREIAYLLSERNKNILEKQNYEIYAATLKERNRIAREIHDNVGHLLSRSLLINGAIKALNKQDDLTEPIESMSETLNNAMTTIRKSVHDMHNDSFDLKESIDGLLENFNKCHVDLKYDCSLGLPSDIKYSFISIIKESLSNIIKHSNATNALIIVREHPAIYQLIIEDNGTGNKMANNSDGIGLINMKERIKGLNGNINIKCSNGFKIFITIPKTVNISKGEID